MTLRFVHTADWQLGKPFAGVEDPSKRALLQQERLVAIDRIGAAAREHQAAFVVVAGDVFDSLHPTKATVSAACSAIGKIGLPVYIIPGNHDHGGPGAIWEQAFFLREAKELAPKLRVLLQPLPVERDDAVLLPCPLLRRHDAADTTQWLRSSDAVQSVSPDKPRIVIAHGSTQRFGTAADDEDEDAGHNLLNLDRLPVGVFDYIALGDWHGTTQINPIAWYAGAPELDRFPKGAEHDAGNILLVTAQRGSAPTVTKIRTARVGWHRLDFALPDDQGVEQLAANLETLVGQRANQDLLKLDLRGTLGLEAMTRLEHLLESYQARLLRIKLSNQTVVAPAREEIAALVDRAGDPLIARVAAKLVELAQGDEEAAAIARVALRELHGQTHVR